MQLTLQEYEQAVSDFSAALAGLGADVVAGYLFGSLVRGDAVPGYSDLDFWLFLADETLADQQRLTHFLEQITTATRTIGTRGIPVYNACCYLSASEIKQLPAMLAPNLADPGESRCIAGTDLRRMMAPSRCSQAMNQLSLFWEMRRRLYLPLFAYLDQFPFASKAEKKIWQALHYFKYLPETICAALGQYPGTQRATAVLENHLPNGNWQLFAEIRQFCLQSPATIKPEDLNANLKSVLSFIEDVAVRLQNEARADG